MDIYLIKQQLKCEKTVMDMISHINTEIDHTKKKMQSNTSDNEIENYRRHFETILKKREHME